MKYTPKNTEPYIGFRVRLKYIPHKFEFQENHNQIGVITQITRKNIKFKPSGMNNARSIDYSNIIDISREL